MSCTDVAVQAHRGSPDPAAGYRENTLEAFARARALGADGVELDVRLTADGGLAVHHDPVIDGVGPSTSWPPPNCPTHVPLLADALDACTGMVVNIEVKNLPHRAGLRSRPTGARWTWSTWSRPSGDRIRWSSPRSGRGRWPRCARSAPTCATGLLVVSVVRPG